MGEINQTSEFSENSEVFFAALLRNVPRNALETLFVIY